MSRRILCKDNSVQSINASLIEIGRQGQDLESLANSLAASLGGTANELKTSLNSTASSLKNELTNSLTSEADSLSTNLNTTAQEQINNINTVTKKALSSIDSALSSALKDLHDYVYGNTYLGITGLKKELKEYADSLKQELKNA